MVIDGLFLAACGITWFGSTVLFIISSVIVLLYFYYSNREKI